MNKKENSYLFTIKHYFRGSKQFVVNGFNKNDARLRAEEFAKRYYSDGNYDLKTIGCIKKIKTKE